MFYFRRLILYTYYISDVFSLVLVIQKPQQVDGSSVLAHLPSKTVVRCRFYSFIYLLLDDSVDVDVLILNFCVSD